jgi:hypothetical protein
VLLLLFALTVRGKIKLLYYRRKKKKRIFGELGYEAAANGRLHIES